MGGPGNPLPGPRPGRKGADRMSRLDGDGTLGITKGTALYVSAIIGPGILTLPGLAIADAGPSALAVLAAVLLLSVPVATTLAAIGRKVPIGGIPAAVT